MERSSSIYASPESESFYHVRDVLCSHEPMTKEEEVEAFARMLAGDESAKEEIAVRNQRYVLSVANSMKWARVPLEDLISAGNYGMMVAANRFNPEVGIRFITYARWYIRSHMQELLFSENYAVSLPRANWPRVQQAAGLIKSEIQKGNPVPGSEWVAKKLGTERSFADIAMVALNMSERLDDDDDDKMSLYDDVRFSVPPTQHDDEVQKKIKRSVEDVMCTLSEREQYMLDKRFWEGWTLDQIAEKVGLSRQGVSNAIEKCLDGLYFDDELKELWR